MQMPTVHFGAQGAATTSPVPAGPEGCGLDGATNTRPSEGSKPSQIVLNRPARALPYKIYSDCRVDAAEDKFWIDLVNAGRVGAAFYVYSTKQPQQNPRRCTVSAAQQLTDYWPLSELKEGHKLSAYGPNGFLSEFACDQSSFSSNGEKPEEKLRHDSLTGQLHLPLNNGGSEMYRLQISSACEAGEVRHYRRDRDQSTAT
jgi:phospholipase C